MAELILLKDSSKVEFTDIDYIEMRDIRDTCPKLREVSFRDCVIPDFSILEMFSECDLYFYNCKILDQSIPITLNSRVISFSETVLDYRRLFFMTNMPFLKDIRMLYDSFEGVKMYAPHLHLLTFFPTLVRIRLLCETDGYIYGDMNHEKVLDRSGVFDNNLGLLIRSGVDKNLDFIAFMPNYAFKGFDGIPLLIEEDEIVRKNILFKKLWINPKYLSHYEGFKYHDLKKVQEVLKLSLKLSREYKTRLGVDFRDFGPINPWSTWPDLSKLITFNLRYARLGSSTVLENEEPELSSLYNAYNQRLYNTFGHNVIVNSRGSIISDTTIDRETETVENHLLPF